MRYSGDYTSSGEWINGKENTFNALVNLTGSLEYIQLTKIWFNHLYCKNMLFLFYLEYYNKLQSHDKYQKNNLSKLLNFKKQNSNTICSMNYSCHRDDS